MLGAAESGVGAAILAKKEGFDVFVSDMSSIKDKYKQLKEYCDGVQAQLDAKTNEVNSLKEQIESLKSQNQQSAENDKQAKDAFMQEISKVIEDANRALADD